MNQECSREEMKNKKETNSFVQGIQEVNKLPSAPNKNEYTSYHLYFTAVLPPVEIPVGTPFPCHSMTHRQ